MSVLRSVPSSEGAPPGEAPSARVACAAAQVAPTRHLAAIFAAEIEGYSRSMGRDEVGTVEILSGHREIIDAGIAGHGGRIANTAGDSVLAEFPSVVGAVGCAVEVQRALAERNARLSRERRLGLRIGVHVGDVIVRGGDLLGDGVNHAARLEGIAEAGGICLSAAAYEQVRNALPLPYVDLGPRMLKNIAEPVRVYAISPARGGAAPLARPALVRLPRPPRALTRAAALAVFLAASAGGLFLWPGAIDLALGPSLDAARSPERPRLSLVVLPLANLSGDPEQDYLAEGVAENLTATLSRIPGSFVIAHGTAATYKGRLADPKGVGRELGVRYVVQGSLRRAGDQIRLGVQLVDADSDATLWVERYERLRGDLPQVEDEVVAHLARMLDVQLVEAESQRVGAPDAADLAMRGQALLNRPFARENAAALPLFERAVAIDARSIPALLGLGEVTVDHVLNNWSRSKPEDLARAEQAVAAVLAMEPNHAFAHYLRGQVLRAHNKHEESLAAFERVIALDPNSARAYAYRGLIKLFLGRAGETQADNETAIRLSPKDPLLGAWYARIGLAQLHLGRHAEAIEVLHRAAAVNPKFDFPHLYMASAYAWLGREAEAQAALGEFKRFRPGYTLASYKAQTGTNNPVFRAQRERVYEGLRRAGLAD